MNTDYTPKGIRKSISLRKLNQVFPLRENVWFSKAILFEEKDYVTLAIVPSILAKLLVIVTFPVLAQAYLLTGNYLEFKREIKNIFQPLKGGAFSLFDIRKDSKEYEQIKDLIS